MSDKVWLPLMDGFSEGEPAEKSIRREAQDTDGWPVDSSMVITYRPQGIWKFDGFQEQTDSVVFDLPEAGYMTRVGGPKLIREGLFAAIPQGAEFAELEIVNLQRMELDGEYDVLPVPRPVLETEPEQYVKDPEIYSSDEPYPSVQAEYVGESTVMGVRCAQIFLYPMQYRPESKKITLFSEITLKLHFRSTDRDGDGSDGAITNKAFQPLILGYEPKETDGDQKPHMLIITTAELEYSLKIYEGKKSFLYDVDLVLTEDIYKKYPSVEHDEAIRNYLIAEHNRLPLSYVVLGGGVNCIPTHKTVDHYSVYASDSYYCTEGESSLPRFALARFPAETREALSQQADIASYYDRFYNETRKRTVFTTYNQEDYVDCKEYIASAIASDFLVVKCYDGQCDKQQLIQEINKGSGFINYRGHGSWDRWASSNGLTIADVPQLNVGKNTPSVLSIACSNSDLYKRECFGAAWINHCKAVSFLGASAPSYTYVNHNYDKFLWEAIYSQKLTTIGDIYVWATLKLYQNDPSSCTRTNIQEYLLLGDVSADYTADHIIRGFDTPLETQKGEVNE